MLILYESRKLYAAKQVIYEYRALLQAIALVGYLASSDE